MQLTHRPTNEFSCKVGEVVNVDFIARYQQTEQGSEAAH